MHSRGSGLLLLLLGVIAAEGAQVRLRQQAPNNNLPVVLWHGMGDSCCSQYSIGAVAKLIEETLGVFVLSIATGDGEAADVWSSYFGDLNTQVAGACEKIRSTKELQHGYNAVGFSQGGVFLRALVQRCQHLGPKAHVLITMGSPHQGVMNIPGCSYIDGDNALTTTRRLAAAGSAQQQPVQAGSGSNGQAACRAMQALLSKGAYLPIIQNNIIQAQYYKDPNHMDQYLTRGIFLPDINQEHEVKSQQYKAGLASLDKLVMFRFSEDKTVVPRDSAWFSFYNGTTLLSLQEQELYKQDYLGLQELDTAGKLVYDEAPGAHMHFTFSWFATEVLAKYMAV